MDDQGFRDRLRTVDTRGNRLWVYADVAQGPLRRRRKILAYSLIAFYLFIPWFRFNNLPLFQLDFSSGRIIFVGQIFAPSETSLFLPLIFGSVLFILALTAWAGRVWCGWACPQTVFLEFVYRPLEQFIEGRPGAQKILSKLPISNPDKLFKKLWKWTLFILISFWVANTFLAFFIGTDQLLKVMNSSPGENPRLFAVMCLVFVGFLFNFGWFREQMCTIACPYGRLQSVLLDNQSIVVGYDKKRGEPRGKGQTGDCVDCRRCVQVCPTGIDIRDGVQMECVNCTACIDACNIVMAKVNKKPDLIKYTSENQLKGLPQKIQFRPFIYLGLSTVMFALGIYWMTTRNILGVEVLRSGAVQFEVEESGLIENHIRLRIENKGLEDAKIEISSLEKDVQVITPQNGLALQRQAKLEFEIFVKAPRSAFSGGLKHMALRITGTTLKNGVFTKNQNVNLFGPEI